MTQRSKKSPIKKLAAASGVSVALLFGAILPAEFGIDPTGMGAYTGLAALAEGTPAVTQQPYESVLEFNIEDYDNDAEKIERSIKGLVTLQDAPFVNETIEIQIEDLGEVEYKFIMQEGMSFVYSWEVQNASGSGVYYDFHGHPRASDVGDYPEGFEMAYSKSEGNAQSGSFRAPFGGLHGFYFMNLEEGPITVTLNVNGYFDDHQEVYRAVDGRILTQLDL